MNELLLFAACVLIYFLIQHLFQYLSSKNRFMIRMALAIAFISWLLAFTNMKTGFIVIIASVVSYSLYKDFTQLKISSTKA